MKDLKKLPPFKCRASAINKIMTDAAGKSPAQMYTDTVAEIERLTALNEAMTKKDGKMYTDRAAKIAELSAALPGLKANKDKVVLSATCISYLREWMIFQLTGVEKKISSKEMEKGNYVELDSIAYAGEKLGWFMPEKNYQSAEDEYFTGVADIVLPDAIPDLKNSWDLYTHPMFASLPDDANIGQINIYCHLYGKPKGMVVRTLMEVPEDVPGWWTASMPENIEDLPEWMRLKVWHFERDDNFIEAAKKRVLQCRTYIQDVLIPEMEYLQQNYKHFNI